MLINNKVCIITTAHEANDTRIYYKQARSLSMAGYDIYLFAQNNKQHHVSGMKFTTFKKPNNRLIRIVITNIQAYTKAKKVNALIYHFHDPEYLFFGLLLKIQGKIVIYDVHEDVSKQILSKSWIPYYIRRSVSFLFKAFEKFAASFFDAVIVATPAIEQNFRKSSKNVIVVQNYPLLEEIRLFEKKRKTSASIRHNNVIYVGRIAENRGIKEMVEAISILKDRKCKLILCGNYDSKELESNIKSLIGWSKVSYKGWVNREKLAEVLNEASIGLVLIYPEERYKVSLPVKMFEYMAAGIPVVASRFPLWQEIIEENCCGLTVEPLKPAEIASAIEYLLTHTKEADLMGNNGRKAVKEKYNWAIEEKKMLDLYRMLCEV